MDHLHALVIAGKVLYLAVADTPAWIVSAANEYAHMAHKTPFCMYQGGWNVFDRSFERDIIPMARQYGLALAPWNVFAGGRIHSDTDTDCEQSSDDEETTTTLKALQTVADETRVKSVRSVAIAYLMQKTTYVFPTVSGRKVELFKDYLDALTISLTDEQMEFIENAKPLDLGFPHTLIVRAHFLES